MNIINIGGWYVGNTAVLDWMDGFEELAVIKGDLNVMRLENGIMDMLAADSIEKKLLIVDSQKTQCYRGLYKTLRSNAARYTKRLFKKKSPRMHTGYLKFYFTLLNYLNKYEKNIHHQVPFNEFEFWRNWISSLTKLDSADKKYQHVIYQNPFFYDETYHGHKNIWPKLLNPYKLIFVHRDPLDQFSDIVKDNGHLNASWPRFHGETELMHPADRFFTICKKLYEARIRMSKIYTEDQLIIFSFEDFIQKNDAVAEQLKFFLDIKSRRSKDSSVFDINKSNKNIGVGLHNDEVKELLNGKNYVMETLSELRQTLKDSPCSLKV